MNAAPPLPVYRTASYPWPKDASPAPPTAPASTCSCTKTVALSVQQGATLSTKITLTVTDSSVTPPATSPVDLTGITFQFTAKTSQDTPDNDPSTIIIDWKETTTPQQGFTWLVIPAGTTFNMQMIAYVMQVRMVSPSGVVTPLVGGTITVTEPPASARGGTLINPLGV